MTGLSVSRTVTVKEQVAWLPDASVAVQVTVVVPVGKNEPEAGLQTTLIGPGQLSVAVGAANVTTAPHWPGSLPVTILAGQLPIAGFSVSRTMIWKLHDEVLPAASVAAQRTVLVPFGKIEPEDGLQTAMTPGLLSVAVTEYVTTAEHSPGSVPFTRSTGQVITGFWLSRISDTGAELALS